MSLSSMSSSSMSSSFISFSSMSSSSMSSSSLCHYHLCHPHLCHHHLRQSKVIISKNIINFTIYVAVQWCVLDNLWQPHCRRETGGWLPLIQRLLEEEEGSRGPKGAAQQKPLTHTYPWSTMATPGKKQDHQYEMMILLHLFLSALTDPSQAPGKRKNIQASRLDKDDFTETSNFELVQNIIKLLQIKLEKKKTYLNC